jgi:hypothetical protein
MIRQEMIATNDNITLTKEMSGKIILVGANNRTVTLPADAVGGECYFEIWIAGNEDVLTITPVGTDAIALPGLNSQQNSIISSAVFSSLKLYYYGGVWFASVVSGRWAFVV